MGRIARVLNFITTTRNGARIRESEVNPGGGANVTAPHFSSIGDDSHPLPGDYEALVPDSGSGRENGVGYLDPKNQHKAGPGEVRRYARASNGEQVVEVWLKNDGSAIIENENGRFTLHPDGEFNINGARITPSGDVITAQGASLNNHYHTQGADSDGDAEQDTSPAVPTE